MSVMKTIPAMVCVVAIGMLMVISPSFALERLDDADITQAIEQSLIADENVSAHLVDVNTEQGVVLLTGTIDNIMAKEQAARIARSIKGVRSVVNNIRVATIERSDSELQQDVVDALFYDPATESYEVEVTVNNGIVTLTGTVNSWIEKQMCGTVAKTVKGVVDVENNITMVYPEDRLDHEIQQEIEKRLRLNPFIDEALLDIEVHNDTVFLSGAVGSSLEKERAYDLSWITGVEAVKYDNLRVEWWMRDDMRREDKFVIVPDRELEQAVRDAFLYDPRVSLFEIDVEAENGMVTLSGTVDNLAAKQSAEQDVRNTIGVLGVNNHVKVRPIVTLTDREIEAEIERSFQWDYLIDLEDISVYVVNKKAYLYGSVGTYGERIHAGEIAARTKGVVEIENSIRVESPWVWQSDYEIKLDVQAQLFWDPLIDLDEITVTVDDGVVTLTGTVETMNEYNAAINDAFAGGARSVESELEVVNIPRYYDLLDTYHLPVYPYSMYPHSRYYKDLLK